MDHTANYSRFHYRLRCIAIYLRVMQFSVWEKESFFEPQDFIIIGSGLVGLWTALELKTRRPGLRISILERGVLPYGASTRNAGFACFGSPTELLHDLELLGEDRMWSIVEMRYKGIEKMNRMLKDHDIGFERCGGYEVYEPEFQNWHELEENVHLLNKGMERITGIPDCFTWADDKLKDFGFTGFGSMIGNRLEGYVHSGKLVKALMQLVQSIGVQIFNSTEVKRWEKHNGFMHIQTSQDLVFTTAQVLVAANAFTPTLLQGVQIKPARGQVILTAPVEDLPFKGTFHFEEGFYYFRNLGNRILLGGARNTALDAEATTDMQTSEAIQQRLEQFIAEHLLPGRAFEVEQRWSGIMGFTDDKQPVVKRLDDHVTVAVSCNGMGLALAPIIAEKVFHLVAD